MLFIAKGVVLSFTNTTKFLPYCIKASYIKYKSNARGGRYCINFRNLMQYVVLIASKIRWMP